MIRWLMRNRRWLPRPCWTALRKIYWDIFWAREKSREENITQKRAKPVAESERAVLIECIADFYPFIEVLEVGSGFGANFHVLGKLFPDVGFIGIDADLSRAEAANNYLAESNIKNAKVISMHSSDLGEIPDNSADIVFSCACLLYIPPEQIQQVVRDMCRIARRVVICVEQHDENLSEDAYIRPQRGESGYWVRNYKAIFSELIDGQYLHISPVPKPRWTTEQWDTYASLIEVIVDG